MIQETDILLPPAWGTLTSPHPYTLQDIWDSKRGPSQEKDPEIWAAPQCTFCIRRNVDQGLSFMCRVDQWSCPQLWPYEGLDSQRAVPNLLFMRLWLLISFHTKSQAVTLRQSDGAGVGAGNSGLPTAFNILHYFIWAGPKGSAS